MLGPLDSSDEHLFSDLPIPLRTSGYPSYVRKYDRLSTKAGMASWSEATRDPMDYCVDAPRQSPCHGRIEKVAAVPASGLKDIISGWCCHVGTSACARSGSSQADRQRPSERVHRSQEPAAGCRHCKAPYINGRADTCRSFCRQGFPRAARNGQLENTNLPVVGVEDAVRVMTNAVCPPSPTGGHRPGRIHISMAHGNCHGTDHPSQPIGRLVISHRRQ